MAEKLIEQRNQQILQFALREFLESGAEAIERTFE